jgi:hypothetical protein
MSCSEYGKIISTSDIINSCLQLWRDTVIPSNRLQDNRPDTIIPLSKERLDMAAYIYIYISHGKWLCFRKRLIKEE